MITILLFILFYSLKEYLGKWFETDFLHVAIIDCICIGVFIFSNPNSLWNLINLDVNNKVLLFILILSDFVLMWSIPTVHAEAIACEGMSIELLSFIVSTSLGTGVATCIISGYNIITLFKVLLPIGITSLFLLRLLNPEYKYTEKLKILILIQIVYLAIRPLELLALGTVLQADSVILCEVIAFLVAGTYKLYRLEGRLKVNPKYMLSALPVSCIGLLTISTLIISEMSAIGYSFTFCYIIILEFLLKNDLLMLWYCLSGNFVSSVQKCTDEIWSGAYTVYQHIRQSK